MKLPVRYLTTAEAAKATKLSIRVVQKRIQRGEIPVVEAGQIYLIDPKHLSKLQPRKAGYPKGRPRKVAEKI